MDDVVGGNANQRLECCNLLLLLCHHLALLSDSDLLIGHLLDMAVSLGCECVLQKLVDFCASVGTFDGRIGAFVEWEVLANFLQDGSLLRECALLRVLEDWSDVGAFQRFLHGGSGKVADDTLLHFDFADQIGDLAWLLWLPRGIVDLIDDLLVLGLLLAQVWLLAVA